MPNCLIRLITERQLISLAFLKPFESDCTWGSSDPKAFESNRFRLKLLVTLNHKLIKKKFSSNFHAARWSKDRWVSDPHRLKCGFYDRRLLSEVLLMLLLVTLVAKVCSASTNQKVTHWISGDHIVVWLNWLDIVDKFKKQFAETKFMLTLESVTGLCFRGRGRERES